MSTTTLAPSLPMRAPASVTRVVIAGLAWTAAAIHLVLTPEHFDERTAYGLFFLGASLFQLWLGWALLRHPRPSVYRIGALGSLGLIATWIVTRAVVPPISPEGRVEPVDPAGVIATGAELATLLLLASALPVPSVIRRMRWAWAAAAGLAFGLLFLLASSAVSYVPWVAKDLPYFNNEYGGITFKTPFIIGMPLPHIWIVGAWSTFALTGLAAVLVATNVALAMGPRAAVACGSRRRTILAAAPALFVVSSCCGAPAALFLGVPATVALARVGPWLLVSTVVMLALNVGLTAAQRRRDPRRQSRPPVLEGAPSTHST